MIIGIDRVNIGTDRAEWLELSRLLDQALDLPDAEREQWLDTLDSADDALKEKLRRLLSHPSAVTTDDFLRQLPPVECGTNAQRAGAKNAIVGPYRLVREIADGGMGSVWLAERNDGLVNRPVALKLPHRTWRHAQLAERMAREREILAALNHPNIATLYDAGIADDGQPYLALEYVDGEPIDAYCRSRPVSLRARLALFLQVTRAVAHAHAKLIVHRDLKPSNVLVTPAGEVRLLDFGIAKLLEGSTPASLNLTEMSGRALTPSYAAPEQIRGEPLTVAADIYSLGVVLYELLAGTRPYQLERDSRGALETAILEAEPRKPSEVAAPAERKALRGDLDTIVLKALKKEPHERYATVHALADDIERYLKRRPVLAQPDSWRYRMSKLVARNKVAVSATVTVLVAIVAGGALALWEARTARIEKQRAEDVRQFLTSVLQNANPYTALLPTNTVESWLVHASNSIEQRADLSPELRVEALTILGTALLNAQNTADGESALTSAVSHAQAELGSEHALTIHARVAFAALLRFRGRTNLLRAQLDELLPRLRKNPGPYPDDLLITLRNKTHLELEDGHYAQAEAAAREELDAAMRTLGPKQSETVTALMMLALATQRSREPAYALEVTERAYDATLEQYHRDPRYPRVIEAERLYGSALGNAGRLPDALAHLRTAVNSAGAVFGRNSRMTGLYMVELARVELKDGDLDGALADSRTAVAGVALHADKHSYRYADALAVRGDALLATGHTQDAVDDLRTATEILNDTLGPTHPLTKATAATLDSARQQQLARAPASVQH
jgi:serine/threonine-protein kinase